VTAALPGDAETDTEPAHEPTASLLLINASIGRRRNRAMVPLGPGGGGPTRAIRVFAHRPRVGAGAARGEATVFARAARLQDTLHAMGIAAQSSALESMPQGLLMLVVGPKPL
jgi:hypothetical protein